jgi:hypothetical protein
VPETISIPARFNGPKESGNGGYSAGAVAQFLDGAAEVSLRAPVPLDTPLAVEREGDDAVRVLYGETLIAEGRAAPGFELGVPAPVGRAAAHEAQRSYRAPVDGPFSHCFVCGRAREDAFGVFAGVVEGRDLVASPWTPPEWTAGPDGHVRPEFLWAVLDCPTYFALYAHDDELPMSVLGRMTARVDGTATPGDEHVVIAWPLGREGRKHRAGAAVLSPGGTPIAVAEALLIELAPAQPS